MMEELIRQGFEAYLTSVGGSGLGILSPYAEHREPHMVSIREEPGQLTPPGTPGPRNISKGSTPSHFESLRQPFLSTNLTGMPKWADKLGRWSYV